jgi:hypothetical protein
MDITGVDIEERFTQLMFIVYNGHDGAIILPYADPVEGRFVQVGMTVHILPGRLQPIPIFILWLEEANQKIADGGKIIRRTILAKYYTQRQIFFKR